MENVYLLIKEYQDQEALIFINASEVDITVKSSQMQKFLPEAKALYNLKTDKLFNLGGVGSFVFNKFSAEIFLVRK